MNRYGFIKVAAAVPQVKVADPVVNAGAMEALLVRAAKEHVQVVVFPELGLTGYTCGDLFLQPLLVQTAQQALADLLRRTQHLNLVFIAGLPVRVENLLLDAAVVCCRGKILGIVPKTYLSNHRECCEPRWFASALEVDAEEVTLCGKTVPLGTDLLFEVSGAKFGLEIGTDLWAGIPASYGSVLQGADLIFNLSAGAALVGKADALQARLAEQSARGISGYVYASCGAGESTTDSVFGGEAFIYENGSLLAQAPRFAGKPQLISTEIDVECLRAERNINTVFRTESACQTAGAYLLISCGLTPEKKVLPLCRRISAHPFLPDTEKLEENCREIFNIQVAALATRWQAVRAKTVVVGVSGGLDSTLTLLVAADACDKLGLPRKQVIGVTMPGFGTTDRTYKNALLLMKHLGVTCREINIKKACLQHFKDIGHDEKIKDATYENTQARERTQVLMDLANRTSGLVIGTGDLSELALGWATYNGDHMSMYGVNGGIPKTMVKLVTQWVGKHHSQPAVRRVLQAIVDTPISPELLPASAQGKMTQKTEELVGPYELHDFFLFYFLRYGFGPAKIYYLAAQAFRGKFTATVIKKWLKIFFRRFFSQQFKRSCLPDGPKVMEVSLSPRDDWHMPSDAGAEVWLAEIEMLR